MFANLEVNINGRQRTCQPELSEFHARVHTWIIRSEPTGATGTLQRCTAPGVDSFGRFPNRARADLISTLGVQHTLNPVETSRFRLHPGLGLTNFSPPSRKEPVLHEFRRHSTRYFVHPWTHYTHSGDPVNLGNHLRRPNRNLSVRPPQERSLASNRDHRSLLPHRHHRSLRHVACSTP